MPSGVVSAAGGVSGRGGPTQTGGNFGGGGKRQGAGNENAATGSRPASERSATYGGSFASPDRGGLGGFVDNMLKGLLNVGPPTGVNLGLLGKIIGAFTPAVGPAMSLTGLLQAMGVPSTPINRTGGMPAPNAGPLVGPGPERGGSGSGGNGGLIAALVRAMSNPGVSQARGPVIDTFTPRGPTGGRRFDGMNRFFQGPR